MKLIDTHSHLFWDSFKDDFDEVIKKAADAGVTTLINVGVDVKTSKLSLDLEPNNPEVEFYSAIGLHPHEAYLYTDDKKLEEDIAALEKIYNKNPKKVIGVGECGLDYLINPEYNPDKLPSEKLKELQIKLFQAQINLAKKLNLPLLIHCRDDRSKNSQNSECWNKTIEMTKSHFGIYHCYSGLLSTTYNLSPNFLVSFAGNLTYPKNNTLHEAARIVPIERIVLETDCPFLPPQSIRGKRNEPSSVKEIAQFLAEIKNIAPDEVASQTTKNALELFRLQT